MSRNLFLDTCPEHVVQRSANWIDYNSHQLTFWRHIFWIFRPFHALYIIVNSTIPCVVGHWVMLYVNVIQRKSQIRVLGFAKQQCQLSLCNAALTLILLVSMQHSFMVLQVLLAITN